MAERFGSGDFRGCGSTTGKASCDIDSTIVENPVKAGLADKPETYPYCFTYLAKRNQQG